MAGWMPFGFPFPNFVFPMIIEKGVFLVEPTEMKVHELSGRFIFLFGRACCDRDEIEWLFASGWEGEGQNDKSLKGKREQVAKVPQNF